MSISLTILAVETSCDETAVSILRSSKNSFEILSNEISSQVKLHAKWGGVVPNLAAREHVKNIVPVFELALKNAGITMHDVDAIAVTEGPGLIPALMVGNNFAKTLAYLYEKPLLGIHHIEGHIYANFVSVNSKFEIRNSKKNQRGIKNSKLKIKNSLNIKFPILCLVVSGGHTQLILMKNHLKYEIIGQTLDDAVGEAFDKVARILGIGYPGGPIVAQWAAKRGTWNVERDKKNVMRYAFQDMRFPRPMLNKQGFNFSFSGLKTAVLYEVKKYVASHGSSTSIMEVELPQNYISAVCHEFQQATIDVLVSKTLKAAEKHKPKTIMLAGGVSANSELRKQLGEAIEKNLSDVSYLVPDLSLTGDNAAMIASAAAFRWHKMSATQKKKSLNGWKTLQPDANLKLK